tara:strand:+ start:2911 stop:3414 length:504 start_codon:yes stop_codon:yes gene_type:complete
MKVKIGNYSNRLICNAHTRHMNKKYKSLHWPEEAYWDYGDHVWEAIEDAVQSVYNVFNWLWFDRRTQKVKVHIHRWDTWSMDDTLAVIILPMLKQLKETKHSYPQELSEEEWDDILDEMIWAFEQKCKDDWISEYDYKWDSESVIAHQGRMTDGFRLFGRFYENLWD